MRALAYVGYFGSYATSCRRLRWTLLELLWRQQLGHLLCSGLGFEISLSFLICQPIPLILDTIGENWVVLLRLLRRRCFAAEISVRDHRQAIGMGDRLKLVSVSFVAFENGSRILLWLLLAHLLITLPLIHVAEVLDLAGCHGMMALWGISTSCLLRRWESLIIYAVAQVVPSHGLRSSIIVCSNDWISELCDVCQRSFAAVNFLDLSVLHLLKVPVLLSMVRVGVARIIQIDLDRGALRPIFLLLLTNYLTVKLESNWAHLIVLWEVNFGNLDWNDWRRCLQKRLHFWLTAYLRHHFIIQIDGLRVDSIAFFFIFICLYLLLLLTAFFILVLVFYFKLFFFLFFFRADDVLEAVRNYCLWFFEHGRVRDQVLRVLILAVLVFTWAPSLQRLYLFDLSDVEDEADLCGGPGRRRL